MNSAFWSGLIEAIVAFCFYADMKGMMVVEVVFEYVMGFVDFVASLSVWRAHVRCWFTCVRATVESCFCAFPCDL